MQWLRTMTMSQGTMTKMNQAKENMKTVDMSAGLTTVMEDLEVEDDSMEIVTIDHDNQFNASHAIKKDTDMRTIHLKTKPT